MGMNSNKLDYYLHRTNHNLGKISLRINNKYLRLQDINKNLENLETVNNKYIDLELEGSGDGPGVKRIKKDITALKKTVKKDINNVKKSLKKDVDAVKKTV